jgi:uncharacterized protein (TIGR04255 family)
MSRQRKPAARTRVKFKNPPINELVIGVYFERDMEMLRAEHIGLFWGMVRSDFPKIQQQIIVAPPNFSHQTITLDLSGAGEIYPLPRYWLEAPDGAHLMQIQRNAFLFNWRKRELRYPHFEAVKKGFDIAFARFTDFLESELKITVPGIQIAELTYINAIESCEYWKGPEETPNVIPRFQLPVPDRQMTLQADFNQVTVQKFERDFTLLTTVRNGRAVQNQNRPTLVVELRGIGILGGVRISNVNEWFERAHDRIGESFIGMTSPDIQKRYWEPM